MTADTIDSRLAPSWDSAAERKFLDQQFRNALEQKGIPFGMVDDSLWQFFFTAGANAIRAADERARVVYQMRCMCFMSPGPPWYAAQCKFIRGHKGDCEFGTREEAHAAFFGKPLAPAPQEGAR